MLTYKSDTFTYSVHRETTPVVTANPQLQFHTSKNLLSNDSAKFQLLYTHTHTHTHTHTDSQMLHHKINSMIPKSKTSNIFPPIIAKMN